MKVFAQFLGVIARLSPVSAWLIAGLLALLVGYAAFAAWPYGRRSFRPVHLLALAPFLIPLVMLGFAVAFPQPAGISSSRWREWALLFLLLVQVGLHIFSLVKMPGYRFFALAVAVLQLWLTAAALLTGLMVVTGLWI